MWPTTTRNRGKSGTPGRGNEIWEGLRPLSFFSFAAPPHPRPGVAPAPTPYLRAVRADDHAGAGAMNEQRHNIVAALDFDLGHACTVQALLDELADLVIFNDQVADLLVSGIPAGVPVFDDADAHAVGINFLSHETVSSL